jgi:ribonuclease HI
VSRSAAAWPVKGVNLEMGLNNDAALKIFTDGGCSGNPGPGGWAYVMVVKTFQGEKVIDEKWGAEKNTTNNRMELMAVISARKALKNSGPRRAVVCTDSQYVQKGITEWIKNWKKNSWRTSDKKPVKNQDLWEELDALAGKLPLGWEWVRGHAGNEYNERCDRMTQEAIRSL